MWARQLPAENVNSNFSLTLSLSVLPLPLYLCLPFMPSLSPSFLSITLLINFSPVSCLSVIEELLPSTIHVSTIFYLPNYTVPIHCLPHESLSLHAHTQRFPIAGESGCETQVSAGNSKASTSLMGEKNPRDLRSLFTLIWLRKTLVFSVM